MPLALISIAVLRKTTTSTASRGFVAVEAPVTGSPFQGRVYRIMNKVIDRDEDVPSVATIDQQRRASFADPAVPIQVNDILLIPSAGNPSATERAKVIRVRRYADRAQFDLETGVEPGETPASSQGTPPAP